MDFREYQASRSDDGEVTVAGSVHEPVHWDFSFRICEDDIPGLARMIFCRPVLGIAVRSIFHRHKRHHWSTDEPTHRNAVKEHMRELKEKVALQALDLGDRRAKSGSTAAAGSSATRQPLSQPASTPTAMRAPSASASVDLDEEEELSDDEEAAP